MKKLIVKAEDKAYRVIIGKDSFSYLTAEIRKKGLYENIFIITDKNIWKLFSGKILNWTTTVSFSKVNVYKMNPGESSKSYLELNRIYSSLLDNNYSRDTLILAVGGGVTGDLAGFAASTFMRGVQLVHVPTTLLADVDSAIGGKTGINFNHTKNMIGTFYQPELVLIDTEFLSTLQEREITSGIGEIIKYAFISTPDFFDFVFKNLDNIYSKNAAVLEKVIYESVIFKASVVSNDEKESGLRKILNFGHTFSHAYESVLKFNVKHGEAVIAGIISALYLSNICGFLSKDTLDEFLSKLLFIKLPAALNKLNKESVYNFMMKDKKNKDGKIRFILLKDIGEVAADVESGKKEIFAAINSAVMFLKNRHSVLKNL